MNKGEEYTKKLMELGLSLREARIYLALLRKNTFTATEIAKVSGIPRQKIYELLDNLIKKGICVEKIGKVKRYKAVEPHFAFRSLIDQYKSDFKIKLGKDKKLALELSNDLSVLYDKTREQMDPLEYIEVLKDNKQIHRRWLSLESEAKREILAFTKPPYTAPVSEHLTKEIDTLKRKVKIRSIYEYDDAAKEELIKVISLWVSAGEEARVVRELPMKLVIIDDKITLLPLSDPISEKPSITTMIINHPGFAKAQKCVFETIWDKATSFDEFKATKKLR